VDMFRQVNLTVKEGRVLLTGVVSDPDFRVEAVRLAWQAEDVVEVINEIQVRDDYSWTQYGKDKWIGTQLRTTLTLDEYIQSINYTIEVVNGIVYLMGVGQDEKEIELVMGHARRINGVTQVISYVRVRGETPKSLQTPETAKPFTIER
jgi:osmotically-inducible protein OsmY